MALSASAALLTELVAFDTTSHLSNLELIRFVAARLQQAGIGVDLVYNAEQTKANLLASVGPKERAGIVLSGHTDVVPVAGQAWSSHPFQAEVREGLLYGRGTADMKGFIACAINTMLQAATLDVHTPLHLCLSYDEEIGCIGVRGILDVLKQQLIRPKLVIIGEPTLMHIATGHKGKAVYQAVCRGQEGHSAMAPQYTNAIHIASRVIDGITATQARLAEQGAQDAAYDMPYTTLHIGKINGGKALNIVPNECVVDFEIRHLPVDEPQTLIDAVHAHIEAQQASALPWLDIHATNQYPGLDTPTTVEALRFLQDCLPESNPVGKITFGTEGGLFTQALDCPVLVCGPGSINVAHKPDVYVALSQLDECDAFLSSVLQRLH